jgi:aarF domain-containing kinase
LSQVESEADNAKSGKKGGFMRKVVVLAVVGLLGAGAVTLSPDAKHAYEAAKRSGRVAGTLAVCINE